MLGHHHCLFFSLKGGYFELSAALRKLEMFVLTVFTISEDLKQMTLLSVYLPIILFVIDLLFNPESWRQI